METETSKEAPTNLSEEFKIGEFVIEDRAELWDFRFVNNEIKPITDIFYDENGRILALELNDEQRTYDPDSVFKSAKQAKGFIVGDKVTRVSQISHALPEWSNDWLNKDKDPEIFTIKFMTEGGSATLDNGESVSTFHLRRVR